MIETSYSRNRKMHRPMADINMTSMIDVMMVLLIIFMIATPLMSVGIPVDLPEAEASAVSDEAEPLTISVDKEGKIFVQEREVAVSEIVPLLQNITKNNPNPRIFIRGDKSQTYGNIMRVMGSVTAAGFTRVALIAEVPE